MSNSDDQSAPAPPAVTIEGSGLLKEEPDTFGSANLTVHSPLASVAPDHPMFALIGRVMAEWGQFEHILDLIIWELARHDQIALSCITSQLMGPGPRLLAILALLSYRKAPQSLSDEATKLGHESNNTNAERNRFAHDAWFIEQGTNVVGGFKKMPKGDLVFGIEPEQEERAKEIIEKIKRRQMAAWKLRDRIHAELSP